MANGVGCKYPILTENLLQRILASAILPTMNLHLLADTYKWEVFIFFAVVLFIIDFYGHKSKKGEEHSIPLKEAILWSIFWIFAGLLFGLYVYYAEGGDSTSRYYASFVLEKGLSVDNIAVWLAILTGMSVPKDKWHKLLTWGILGAIVFRGIFIFGGMNLINRFSFLTVVLGFFLLMGAYKILEADITWKPFRIRFDGEGNKFDPEKDKTVQFVKRLFNKFKFPLKTETATFVIVLLTIEITDVVFALDSIPVVIALNDSPFVAASSNLFAIFGLRALFFVVSEFLSRLEYLKFGLSAILFFIASKMILGFHLEPMTSLLVVFVIIGLSVVVSLLHKGEKGSYGER